MCSIDRGADRPMVMGNFGDQYGEAHFNQMGICGIAVRKCMKGLSCLLG